MDSFRFGEDEEFDPTVFLAEALEQVGVRVEIDDLDGEVTVTLPQRAAMGLVEGLLFGTELIQEHVVELPVLNAARARELKLRDMMGTDRARGAGLFMFMLGGAITRVLEQRMNESGGPGITRVVFDREQNTMQVDAEDGPSAAFGGVTERYARLYAEKAGVELEYGTVDHDNNDEESPDWDSMFGRE